MAVYCLDKMLELITNWEHNLYNFYGMMEDYLKDERSRKTAALLKVQQFKNLEMLKAINIDDYRNIEYIKIVPDYHSEAILPHYEIDAGSSPQEIFEKVLSFEIKLEEYYKHLRNILVYSKSREILDQLLLHKIGQIKEIRSFMDTYDMVI